MLDINFNATLKQKFKRWGITGLILLELALPVSSFAQVNQIKESEEKLKIDKEQLQQILATPLKKSTLESAMNYLSFLENYCHSKEDSMQLDLHATNPSTLEDTLKIYFSYLSQNFAFPVDTINSKPEITSPYGIRKNPTKKQTGGPNKKFHDGWDLGVYNVLIFSPYFGKIDSVGKDEIRGKYVVVEYSLSEINKKIKCSFFHLKKIYVSSGKMIKKGEKIATSGNTGLVSPQPTKEKPDSGSHLHFEFDYVNFSNSINSIDPKIIYPQYNRYSPELKKKKAK